MSELDGGKWKLLASAKKLVKKLGDGTKKAVKRVAKSLKGKSAKKTVKKSLK